MKMLEILKEMQRKGVFKLFPCDEDIEGMIQDAVSDAEIIPKLKPIQDYIKSLDVKLKLDYDVPINKEISDFYDKFQYTIYDMYIGGVIKDPKKCIYQKELDFGKNVGNGAFGISSELSIKFTLEERKLFKLINHYYIKLRSNEYYKNDLIYIPFEKLKLIYANDVNNYLLKTSIVETCTNLNAKQVYWNMENTRYNKTKKLREHKLSVVKGDGLVDITIIYNPREHAAGIDGKVNTIKGILCRVTNFMKLRYEIKQISNSFPTECLRSKYLDFVLMDKLIFRLNLANANNAPRIKKVQSQSTPKKINEAINKKIVSKYIVNLVDLSREIYYYDNEQSSTDYFSKMLSEPNVKRRLLEFIGSLANVALMLRGSTNSYATYISFRGKAVMLYSKDRKSVPAKDIYEEILNILGNRETKGKVFKFFQDGEISLKIKL